MQALPACAIHLLIHLGNVTAIRKHGSSMGQHNGRAGAARKAC